MDWYYIIFFNTWIFIPVESCRFQCLISAIRNLRVFSSAFKYSDESIGNLLFIRLPECKMGYYGSHRSIEKRYPLWVCHIFRKSFICKRHKLLTVHFYMIHILCYSWWTKNCFWNTVPNLDSGAKQVWNGRFFSLGREEKKGFGMEESNRKRKKQQHQKRSLQPYCKR